MARAACLVPKNTPVTLTLITCSKVACSLSRILGFTSSTMAALLIIMSNLPYLASVIFMAFSTSDSIVTSQ
ncbi:hypothetical protein HanXRQr2_Chr16g0757511 [Helianthus annuus]|uniref:Uncharacterized protein n=1 Tax=Helianthus annuus TaxID=4232 RepID=A0A9K3DUM4_HELAN|nr:hypothetical protein HanXRQr2_Chr16g0757511 [Helianthus annuus]KAJ0821935.1 hypothetical protein HanPSC8_Chr16g0726031 [Helianthus annuus]